MLAYVFWHWRNPQIDELLYRDLLANFHDTLSANAPAGFLKSVVFSLPHLPWSSTSQPAFEDWYLLEDSAGLDVINHAAVSGACELPHNQVARHAADGTAGLYRVRLGEEALVNARYATWFSKPSGISYDDFYSNLASVTSLPQVGLWQRQMTLGPTNEFAIYAATKINTTALIPTSTELQLVWPKKNK